MNLLDKVSYWVELAEYDLETAKVMLKNKRLLYVGFMCHQTIEKITKGYFEINSISNFECKSSLP